MNANLRQDDPSLCFTVARHASQAVLSFIGKGRAVSGPNIPLRQTAFRLLEERY